MAALAGLSCLPTTARLPINRTASSLHVCCKIRVRQRKLSSQNRRGQAKIVSPGNVPIKMKSEPNDDESSEAQNTDSAGTLHSYALSSTDSESGLGSKTDGMRSSPDEANIEMEDTDRGQELQGVHLEELVGMIKNAEKNILLLNQARVSACEEVDKVLSEKEALRSEMNELEMKLTEADERIKVATEEKINVELLKDNLEKLSQEISSKDAVQRGDHDGINSNNIIQNPDSFVSATETPLLLEIDSLRKENSLVKDDIETLKGKLNIYDKMNERLLVLENERSSLESSLREMESKFVVVQDGTSTLSHIRNEYTTLLEKMENLQNVLDDTRKQSDQTVKVLQQNSELQMKVEKLEATLGDTVLRLSTEKFQQYDELLQRKIEILEERLLLSDQELHSHIQLFQESVEEFHDALNKLKEENKRKSLEQSLDDLPLEFWSRIVLLVDGWLLEKKISSNDAKALRELAWKKDRQIRDAYLASKTKNEHQQVSTFLKMTSTQTSQGLHIIHIAAEMAPVAKVGGLGDVVSGLGKALQRRGHLVEIILPKYDCMQYGLVDDLKVLDVGLQSYFDGKLYQNKIWVGTVEGLPVYFIEPQHPANFFRRGKYYGDHDDFKRFSFFSRAALELLYQAGKKPDIIHCHDWQTAFVAPLYWEIYATKGFDSARICFTCHNFEYQGSAPAPDLASCGLDVPLLNRPDRMQDNSSHDRINPVKGAVVFSNIVTTVSPTYAQEVLTPQGGRGLHETLKFYSKKFVGILNGIDTDAWNPSTDTFLKVQYSADDLEGKADNKAAVRKLFKLSSAHNSKPLIGCITRLVPQKGVHLIRHAIYKTLELGGQFVLLGSSPVPQIQKEFEGIATNFDNHADVRLILKYDDALSHLIYAACDMLIIPSLFEPCGLTQMIAMRYGAVPVVRRTGGLNDSVFDVDDEAVPMLYRNGFTFLKADEQGLDGAMERAFNYYTHSPESWQQLVQKIMRIDVSWDSSASHYEELYEKSVARARSAVRI